MTTRVDEKTKKKVDSLPHINWSEVMRQAILKKLDEEQTKLKTKNLEQIREAIKRIDSLQRTCEGNTTEELRSWRQKR
ncbi:MAG: hypothetical protein ACE5R6_03040 [Candidatus Heimdallarchaeota archaeon]